MLAQSGYSQSPHGRPALGPTRRTPPATAHGLDGTIEMIGASMVFPRNAEIFGESEAAEYLSLIHI